MGNRNEATRRRQTMAEQREERWLTLAMQRRRFLRLTALGAGIASLGLLTACARQEATPTPAPAATPPGPAPAQTPAAAASPAPAGSGTFVIARLTDTITLDPSRQYELTSPIVMGACYERLVTIQPPDIRTVQFQLAEKVDISQDVTTYTFTLRAGPRFASGNPVTSADVVFSFNRLRELKDNPSWLADIIQTMETPDERTVRITLTEPNAAFLAMLVSPNFSVLDSQVVKQQGGTDQPGADKTDKATEWLNQNSAGSGPFVLKGWVKEQEIVMERNPNYWGSPAPLERVIIRHVPDPTAQRQLLERGDVDAAHNLDADLIAEVERAGTAQIVRGDTLDTEYFAMHTSPTVGKELADRRVRQAIAYAIDYDGIIQQLLRGAAVRPPSVIPSGLLGVAEAEDARYRTDPERAKQLLAEAGLANGFELTLTFSSGGTEVGGVSSEVLASKIADDLRKVGIRVTLDPRAPDVRLADYRAGKLQCTISGWTPDFLDPHGWAIPFGVPGEAAAKRVAYDNPQVADLFQRAAKTADPQERARLYAEGQRLLNQDAPFLCLYQPKAQIAVGKNVQGYVFDPVIGVDLSKVRKS
jgi:peptide/nickel transport system substrate-binding protein